MTLAARLGTFTETLGMKSIAPDRPQDAAVRRSGNTVRVRLRSVSATGRVRCTCTCCRERGPYAELSGTVADALLATHCSLNALCILSDAQLVALSVTAALS